MEEYRRKMREKWNKDKNSDSTQTNPIGSNSNSQLAQPTTDSDRKSIHPSPEVQRRKNLESSVNAFNSPTGNHRYRIGSNRVKIPNNRSSTGRNNINTLSSVKRDEQLARQLASQYQSERAKRDNDVARRLQRNEDRKRHEKLLQRVRRRERRRQERKREEELLQVKITPITPKESVREDQVLTEEQRNDELARKLQREENDRNLALQLQNSQSNQYYDSDDSDEEDEIGDDDDEIEMSRESRMKNMEEMIERLRSTRNRLIHHRPTRIVSNPNESDKEFAERLQRQERRGHQFDDLIRYRETIDRTRTLAQLYFGQRSQREEETGDSYEELSEMCDRVGSVSKGTSKETIQKNSKEWILQDCTKDLPKDCEKCTICLEEYTNGENVRLLKCGHIFHADCVDKWLQDINAVCPICKESMK